MCIRDRTDINVINDQEQYKSLMKELKNLTPIIEKYRMYKTARSDFEEAEQMLSDGGLDKDFKEIVQEQYENNKKLMDEYTDELKILLLPKDPDDDRKMCIRDRCYRDTFKTLEKQPLPCRRGRSGKDRHCGGPCDENCRR